MLRPFCFTLITVSFTSFAQVRVEKLVLKPKEVYALAPSDIVVADTLIMMDSSRIRLNGLKTENYIRAQFVVIGNNCAIEGQGINGKRGVNGAKGRVPLGPCQNGVVGRNGERGLEGTSGINLFLYIDKINTIGNLVVNLSGGNGGDGGNGGEGGGGSPGTRHCGGGSGAAGGNGGAGGSGGPGGTLTLGGDITKLRGMLGKTLIIRNKGGTFGYGGVSGYGGAAGLGPRGKNGKPGPQGVNGSHGKPAGNGMVLFENQ